MGRSKGSVLVMVLGTLATKVCTYVLPMSVQYFFVGDVYIILPSGCPTLDLFIGGDNPIDFIMQKRTPSNQMMQEFGQELADNMINPRMKRNIPSSYSGTLGQYREMLNNSDWVFVDYNLITNRCDDNSYKELLRSWGYGTERK